MIISFNKGEERYADLLSAAIGDLFGKLDGIAEDNMLNNLLKEDMDRCNEILSNITREE